MSAVQLEARPLASATPRRPIAVESGPRIGLIGTGGVGSALLARLARIAHPVRLAWIANSRRALVDEAIDPASAIERLPSAPVTPGVEALVDRLNPGDVVVDATASEELASAHAAWLARGLHVVSANKAGLGADLLRHATIRGAAAAAGTHYGDSATVGAGLPLLSSLRSLQAGGDRILELRGVLSGTLAWLLANHDGMQPFSRRVEEARAAGITEPDPRADLSGQDVLRKLLILARTAGMPLEAADIHLEPLWLPEESSAQLDARLAALRALAIAQGQALRYVAELRAGGDGENAQASIGLRRLPAGDPLADAGSDNRLLIRSCRYRDRPLLIQGPGAGADITAAALLGDVAAITDRAGIFLG